MRGNPNIRTGCPLSRVGASVLVAVRLWSWIAAVDPAPRSSASTTGPPTTPSDCRSTHYDVDHDDDDSTADRRSAGGRVKRRGGRRHRCRGSRVVVPARTGGRSLRVEPHRNGAAGVGTEHPSSTRATPSNPPIDCFYVYPTVSPQPGILANLQIDPAETSVAEAQASRFSEDCRVYAPDVPAAHAPRDHRSRARSPQPTSRPRTREWPRHGTTTSPTTTTAGELS